jgi:hypothetical protein
MISLNTDQRRQIVQTAATLKPAARMAFIAVVESTLSRYCLGRTPNNTDVQRVIDYTINAVPWPRSGGLSRFGFF